MSDNLQQKKFQRKKEDFTCGHCNYAVVGNGYTNHCPNCLWSKHVDINPGDRACNCEGLMEPTGLENQNGVFYIVHKCQKCGEIKRNKAAKGDSFSLLVELSNQNL
jgi:hypothetical protein